jgi:hypothetical protein
MIVPPPPLPCPTAPQLILLQTARPGEFEQFGADDGGELRRPAAVLHSPESVPVPDAGLGPATRTDWLRRRRSRTVLIEPEAVSRCD